MILNELYWGLWVREEEKQREDLKERIDMAKKKGEVELYITEALLPKNIHTLRANGYTVEKTTYCGDTYYWIGWEA